MAFRVGQSSALLYADVTPRIAFMKFPSKTKLCFDSPS